MPDQQPAGYKIEMTTQVVDSEVIDGVKVIKAADLIEISISAEEAAANLHQNARWIKEGLDRG